MAAMAFARDVFPAPIGPTIITLCPPEQAISAPRFAMSCPTISEKSMRSEDCTRPP